MKKYFFHKLVDVNNAALMDAGADQLLTTVGLDVKGEKTVLDDLGQNAFGADGFTQRGGGKVLNLKADANGGKAFIHVGHDGGESGTLHACYHAGGGENVQCAAADCAGYIAHVYDHFVVALDTDGKFHIKYLRS